MARLPLCSVATVVAMLIGFLYLSQTAHGLPTFPPECTGEKEKVAYNDCYKKKKCDEEKRDKEKIACQNSCETSKCEESEEDAETLITQAAAQDCTTAKSEWSKAYGGFRSSCSKAGMQTFGSEVGCKTEATLCQMGCDDYEFDSWDDVKAEEYADSRCNWVNDEAEDLEGVSLKDVIKGISTKNAKAPTIKDLFPQISQPKDSGVDKDRLRDLRSRYSLCAPQAAADYADLKEEYSDARDRIDDSEDTVAEMNEALQELMTSRAEKETEYEEQRLELKRTYEARVEDAQEQFKRDNAAIAEQVAALDDAIFKGNYDLQMLEIEIRRVNDATQAKITALRQECLKSALVALNLRRQQRMQAIQTSTYSAGQANNLYRLSSTSKKHRDTYFVDKLAAECEGGEAFKRNVEQFKKDGNTALAEIGVRKAALEATVKKAKDSMAELQKADGKKAEALKNHQKALEKLLKTFNEDFDLWQKRRDTILTRMDQEIEEKKKQVARKQAHMEEDKIEYEEAKTAFSYARRLSRGKRSDMEKYDAVEFALSDAQSKASNFLSLCEDYCANHCNTSSDCKTASLLDMGSYTCTPKKKTPATGTGTAAE